MQVFSPEQVLFHPLYLEKQVNVSIKRDDMIHPFISGNKWRKLKYNLVAASQQGKTKLLTFGGAWSNHLLATACAGASYGLVTKAFVRGDKVHNPVLSMCELFGMELIFVDRESYRNKQNLFNSLSGKDDYYFIDEGGAGHEAMLGCEELISELTNRYDHIICAAGTGTTAAGLASGIVKHELMTELHVIPVLKGGDFILDEIKKLHAPVDITFLHTAYHFGGYAKTKPELIQFIKDFVSKTGIMIEPTYTGKAMYALHDLIAQNYFKKDSKILFIHTGGLTGLLGMMEKFEAR